MLFGAAGKLGRAVAILFAQEGAKLTLVSRSASRLQGLCDQVAVTSEVEAIQADPSTEEGCRRAVAQSLACFGGLDVLYYGASAFQGRELSIDQLTGKDWDLLVGSNLQGAFFACKYAFPAIAQEGGGSAILMGGTEGDWLARNVAYAAAKAGLLGLTRRLAREWREHNVRVNVILPSLIPRSTWAQTVAPVHEPLMGEGKPEDIAYLALFLASQESRYITGVAVPVDGGRELFPGGS